MYEGDQGSSITSEDAVVLGAGAAAGIGIVAFIVIITLLLILILAVILGFFLTRRRQLRKVEQDNFPKETDLPSM